MEGIFYLIIAIFEMLTPNSFKEWLFIKPKSVKYTIIGIFYIFAFLISGFIIFAIYYIFYITTGYHV